jgi:uncharacterized protein (TIGR03437 family)
MNRRIALLLLCFGFAAAAVAQPVIRSYAMSPQGPVLNSASYIGPELGNGAGIAQGSIFALFGTGFGPSDSYAEATTFPLQKTLGGTSVTVTVGGTSTSAIMLFVIYGQQINAVLPSATPVGNGTITVTYGGVTSAPAPIVVVPSSFGIYSANNQGTGQAAATNGSYSQNSIIQTFHPGDIAILWGTGLGAVSWDETQDPSTLPPSDFVSLSAPVEVYVGNTPAVVGYHGRSGCCSGLDQIVFTVPQGVQGCYVPVVVQAGAVLGNFTTIAVSNNGQTCSDSIMGQDLIDQLAAGQNVTFGWVQMAAGFGGYDYASATFNEFTPATAKLAAYGVSSGYCMPVEWGSYNGLFPNDFTVPYMNAGSALTLQGPAGAYQIPEVYFPGTYSTQLTANNSYIVPAGVTYSISGPGGPDVGAFTVSDAPPVFPAQLSVASGTIVPRGSDLKVMWNSARFPQPTGTATLGGYVYVRNADLSEKVVSFFQCTVSVAPGEFTIPALVLSGLPESGSVAGSNSYVWIGQYTTPTTFTATGLDKGLITTGTFSISSVFYQ